MTNADVARVFQEVADLLEIKGADAFRINAYRRVARTIDDLAEEVTDVAARGALADLPGVGKSSAEKIQELLDTGELTQRRELAAEIPESVLELLDVPGLGPKKAAQLYHERGIASRTALKEALAAGALGDLKGFGDKTITQIKEGLAFLDRSAGRRRLSVAAGVAQRIASSLRERDDVQRVEIAGSLRRGKESIGDIDLLCVADDGPAVVQAVVQRPDVQKVLGSGDTKGSALVEYRPGRTIQVDVRVIPAASFGAAWQYFTGSKEHNVRLRERAVKRGWSLSEYGLTEGDRVLAAREERDIYAALDLPWIPPELREDRLEFELDEIPADLITVKAIRGDLHMHTSASDGVNTIAQMAEEAQRRGYEYICITDHSQSSAVANGLSPERLREHLRAVREVAKSFKRLAVLAGAEVDILADGRLDYAPDLLAELDWVVASVHNGMSKDLEANTKRTLAAIESPYVNLIAHPTGRLINRRAAMPLDIDRISQAAAQSGTALEINASDHRLDLKDQHARLARDNGAVIAINTDAHACDEFNKLTYGVLTARRAGLREPDVLNTWPLKRIRDFVARKRKRGK